MDKKTIGAFTIGGALGALATFGTLLLTDKSVRIAENQYYMALDVQRITLLNELKGSPQKLLARLETLDEVSRNGYLSIFRKSVNSDIAFVSKLIDDQQKAELESADAVEQEKAASVVKTQARAVDAAQESITRNMVYQEACGGFVKGRGYIYCP